MSGSADSRAALPSSPFTMLGAIDATVCEGDACLIVPGSVPPSAPVASDAATAADEPGRRGVSR
ncbi:hypothetical protein [Frigoribacterium sp. VKM Ac-1396]|uniref:hypothetical protein n=1 Tax=Frigoribacterium sp. VKM Ac-1396 TaxID=2783821 RepID=UPI001E569568|nr:hypothetical protein [Frigoribacterium sp. VKM Ac-1396]